MGKPPRLPAKHPHRLVLPSLYILRNYKPTASLVTGIIIPVLQMGKLRLCEVKRLAQAQTARMWQRLACLTQKPDKI